MKKKPDEIKKIEEFEEENQHVFDIETETGVVMAGIGNLIVGNSPRRGETFVTRKITMAAARIKLGLQDTIELGNLDAKRDWGFAGDYIEAMWLMLQKEVPDDYVIATNETHSVREFLEEVWKHAELGDPKQHLRYNQKYLRPHEVPVLCGDASKAKRELGWEPKVKFKELANLMFTHDLSELLDRVALDEGAKLKKVAGGKLVAVHAEDDFTPHLMDDEDEEELDG